VRDAVGVVPGDPLRDLPRARPPRPGGPPPHRQHPEKDVSVHAADRYVRVPPGPPVQAVHQAH